MYEAATGKFDEMLGNLREGLKFYADLSRLLGELRDAVKAVRSVPVFSPLLPALR